jgi:Leucine-rich repeat (LRR) protein
MKINIFQLKRLFILILLISLSGSIAFSQTNKKPTTTSKSQKKITSKGQAKKNTTSNSLFQNQSIINFRPGQIDTFQLESVQLVKFFQGMLNFLADGSNSVRDKQTIITQSYLKIFWDPKVQIEDDLEQNRIVPLYKDAPAYLADVSFFFRGAAFTYTVDNASVLNDARGQTYFKVTANRNIKGITINGDSVNWNKVRYLEINYNDSMQQLKIVSIYTTKLDEREDMKIWWNGLPDEWKETFGKGRMIYDTLPLSHISSFRDSTATVFGINVKVDSNRIYNEIQRILRQKSIDLSNNPAIKDLTPLGKLSFMTSLNISNTKAADLTPLRNLNNLEELDISGTNIMSLDPLKFLTKIKVLRMAKTPVSDISLIPGFVSLEILDLSDTPVDKLDLLANLTGLTDLRFSGTRVSSLQPLSGLTNLKVIYLNNTGVADLTGLNSLKKLQMIFCNSTNIKDLSPLDGLGELMRIYCDKSLVNDKEARQFMMKNPSVLVIYKSEALTKWWTTVPPEWKKIFSYYSKLDDTPTTEQLHRLTDVDSINISGRASIITLTPLSMLDQLRRLECANSGISDLKPLENLHNLSNINISNTKVASIAPLEGLNKLEFLFMDNTQVSDLTPLSKTKSLQKICADNSGVNLSEVSKFAEANPGCIVIFQTYDNTNWWKNLPEEWKQIFMSEMNFTGDPDKIRLEQIASLGKLVISENVQISGLQPVLHLSRLKELECNGTPITSLDILGTMKHLKILRVTKNPVSDLTPLSALTGLQELDISNTQVEELEPIQNLTSLETLKFSGTQVKNLKYLSRMVNLKVMEMYNTKVSSLDVLEPMKQLKTLKIFNTKISEKKVAKFKETHPGCDVVYY